MPAKKQTANRIKPIEEEPPAPNPTPPKKRTTRKKKIVTDVMIAQQLGCDKILSSRRYPDGSLVVVHGIGWKSKFSAAQVNEAIKELS